MRSRPRRAGTGGRPQDVPRAGFVGMGAMACLLFCCLATGRLVPWWATALLVVMWSVLMVAASRAFVPRPAQVPRLAAAGFVVWFGTVTAGAWLGLW